MKVKCINDTWSPEQRAIWDRYNIQTPIKGEEYTVRQFIQTRNGDSYLLEELKNPRIPAGNPGFLPQDDLSFEPTFHVDRFVNTEEPVDDSLESVESEEFSLVDTLEMDTYELKRA
jgi:hypothetical protein